jgi:hypothetical protein
MCFNSSISIASYIFGIVNSIILFKRGYEIEGAFYGFIIQMQLIEYLLWSNNKCNNKNKFITKIGISLNHLQPYVLYLLILKYNPGILPTHLHYLMLCFLILNVNYFIINYKLLKKCTIGIENKKELQWKIQYGLTKKFYYLFPFILALLMIKGLKKYNYLNAFLIVITFVASYLKYRSSKGIGTIWCIMSAYIPFLLNIIYELKL